MTGPSKDINHILRLDLIESLIQQKKFKEALAELREREARRDWDRCSYEGGWCSHLSSVSLQALGRYEEALIRGKEAFEIFKNTLENEKIAQIQFNLGIIYSDLGDLKESELQFKDAASAYRRVQNPIGIIKTYNELARIYFTRSDFSRAIEYLNDGLEYCRQIKDDRRKARLSGNLGTIYMIRDEWKLAQKNLLASLELNTKHREEINTCRCLLSLGHLSVLLREFSKAESYLKKAYRIAYENSFVRELAIYHEYSGELSFIQGDLEEAENHYLNAIQIGEKIAPQSAIISQTYRLLAELYTEKGEFEKGLISCEKSLVVSKSIGERLEEALAYRTLGRLYGQNGHPADVKENFSQATRMLEEIGVKFELARTYLDMGKNGSFDFWEKMKFLGRAEDLASQLNFPYHSGKIKFAFALLFFKNKEYENASNFLERAKEIFEQCQERKDLEKVSELEKQIQAVFPTKESSKEPSPAFSFNDIITRNGPMLEMLEDLQRIKDSDITILLEGETGTGKDLLAKAIHFTSSRKNKRFVVVNCAALPETLFESELFGYKKGAFTGASSNKKGLLDEAAGGTLYLDEVAEVPPPIQVKLLRAIEEKEITRLGEVKPQKVDFRVIAATNRNLEKLVEEKRFRSDLYYRLSVIKFKLPPLKERREDIPFLVEHFIKKYSPNGQAQVGPVPEISRFDPKIMGLFLNYDWPGNVRELENDLKSLLVFVGNGGRIPFELLSHCQDKFNNDKSTNHTSLLSQLAEYEKEQIKIALAKSNWIKTKAARFLNIDEALLRYKIKKYNITPL
ncbi:MAG: sigma 54-interacting transcriptional regulator [candidate division Zixibacteria bacterium]|nr:sigma 54-interacting transcriptional regulator [candidate division Zixibacteria bacterium]